MWTYKKVDIYPARHDGGATMDGIRWYARTADDRRFSESAPAMLRADTKAGMRELITHYLPPRKTSNK